MINVYKEVKQIFNGDHKISKDFTLKESMCKCGCNTSILITPQIELVQAVRNWHFSKYQVGVQINSWSRCPKHNKAVGGYKFSKHTTGTATDIAIDPHRLEADGYLQDFLNVCAKNGAKEIGLYWNHSFIHIATEATSKNMTHNIDGIKFRLFEVK